MYTKINLFTPIQNTPYALSCEFDLEYLGFNQNGAFGVICLNLHMPEGTQWRKVAVRFDTDGLDYTRRLCVDTYEYAHMVDKNPEYKAVEKDLCDSVCLLIGRTVRQHFDKE